jgi:hypothetical protein
MRTSFHHQPEAQHPKSPAIETPAGRLPHLWVRCGGGYRHDETGLAGEVETMKIVSLGLEDAASVRTPLARMLARVMGVGFCMYTQTH